MAAPEPPLRVFIDANILFAGIVFPRWPNELLRHAVAGDFQLVLSPLVIQQARRNIQKRFPAFVKQFDAFLDLVLYETAPDPSPEEVKTHQDLLRDLTDVPIALAAIAAKVDYFVSEDKDFTVQDKTTTELHRHLKVRLSGTFLREVMGWTSEELEAIRHRKWSDISVRRE
jgi:predicted nucleic acid-binding protein